MARQRVLQVALWCLASALSGLGSADVYGGVATPIDCCYLVKPEITWNVYSTGGDKIVGGEITINGEKVETRYDETAQCVVGQLSTPLEPGKYVVVAKALFQRGFSYKVDWAFNVMPQAYVQLPDPNDEQLDAIGMVNQWRGRLGLGPVRVEPRLCAAAQKHTEYNAANNTTGHFQRPQLAGFFGEGPAERLQAFGYCGDSYEAVCYGYRNLAERIQSLIDAPYHRIPFFQPGAPAAGAGSIGDRVTFMFEMGSAKAVSVYPYDGQEGVPMAWCKIERPDPLRVHPQKPGVAGYPITLTYYGKDVRLSEVRASLRSASGEELAVLVNTPDNDTWLRNAVIVFPVKPLRPGERYTANVSAKASDGTEIDRTWSFRASLK